MLTAACGGTLGYVFMSAHMSLLSRSGAWLLLAIVLLGSLGACTIAPPYRYRYVPGKTATLQGPYAVAPEEAPTAVKLAIAAGNRITGSPYRYGAGHGSEEVPAAFDCSGAASYVLRNAGLLRGAMPSRGFRRYGVEGLGEWISVYARKDHTFLVVAGLRFDTGWTGSARRGPEWTTKSRPAKGCVVRHPHGY